MVTPCISTSFLQVLSSRPPRGKSRRVSLNVMSRYSSCITASYVRGACRMTGERWPGMLAWGLDCSKMTAETRVSPNPYCPNYDSDSLKNKMQGRNCVIGFIFHSWVMEMPGNPHPLVHGTWVCAVGWPGRFQLPKENRYRAELSHCVSLRALGRSQGEGV